MADKPTAVDATSVHSIMSTIRVAFPDAEVGEDLARQVVIYTGLYQVGDSETPLVSYEQAYPKAVGAEAWNQFVSDHFRKHGKDTLPRKE